MMVFRFNLVEEETQTTWLILLWQTEVDGYSGIFKKPTKSYNYKLASQGRKEAPSSKTKHNLVGVSLLFQLTCNNPWYVSN